MMCTAVVYQEKADYGHALFAINPALQKIRIRQKQSLTKSASRCITTAIVTEPGIPDHQITTRKRSPKTGNQQPVLFPPASSLIIDTTEASMVIPADAEHCHALFRIG
jgi:hypothetical protein